MPWSWRSYGICTPEFEQLEFLKTRQFPSVPVSFLTIKLPEDSTNSVLASFRSDRSKTHKLKKHGSQTLENDSTFASNEIPKIETNNKPATSFDIQNTNMIKSKSGIPKVIQNFQWNEQLLYA